MIYLEDDFRHMQHGQWFESLCVCLVVQLKDSCEPSMIEILMKCRFEQTEVL